MMKLLKFVNHVDQLLVPHNFRRKSKKVQYYLSSLLLVLFVGILALGGYQAIHPHKVTHITLWHGVNPPPNPDILQKLVDKFNQTHSNIQLESLYVGQQDQEIPN
jgi:multiple sugar transport system substrate-binding protein